MTNKILNNSALSAEKLRAALNLLKDRTVNSTALSEILGESLMAFKRFYQEIGDPEFRPSYLETGDTPRSEIYNLNFSQLDSDISRFYLEIKTLADAQISSFNYSKIVNEEITRRADSLASTVLDLKILSDFTRGDVLVAGDDFRTLENVDTGAASGAPKAEKMFGSGGMALKRKNNRTLVDESTDVEVLPLAPLLVRGGQTHVGPTPGTEPTPGNLYRFYEGNYYNFIGSARPEGGRFNIKFLLKPVEDKPGKKGPGPSDPSKSGPTLGKRRPGKFGRKGALGGGNAKGSVNEPGGQNDNTTIDDSEKYSNANAGFYVELGATEEEKKAARTKMFDGDPDTFWEAEYVFPVRQPLIKDLIDKTSVESDSNSNEKGHKDNIPRTASVVIDYKAAERAAKKFDYIGRDLIFDLVITLPEQTNINYVVIDPILFGVSAFIEVLGIYTASEDEGQFILVDGWDAIKYAKTITPEANEFLNTTQVGQLLSPSRFEYTGKGVFPFPSRIAKKIRVRLKMDNPVPAIYERYYILLRQQLEMDTEVKTETKRGFLRRLCWVSRVVVPDRWIYARIYITDIGPKWLYRLYVTYGERFSKFLEGRKWLILLLKPLFLYFAWRGRRKYLRTKDKNA